MRGLTDRFMEELKSGIMMPILELVKLDSTLCLEIRDNYVNIYYRGGNITKIEENQISFKASFDPEYLTNELPEKFTNPSILSSPDNVKDWVFAIAFLKHQMDIYFGHHPKNEREFQQLMLRENNFGNSAKSTDYFICDIEYANSEGRFDLIAVKWPSTPTCRKKNKELRLAFIEMKYIDGALGGTAGLGKHISDINTFVGNSTNLDFIKEEMIVVFNQKMELGLIDNVKRIESFSSDKPEFILALSNHDPESSKLRKELGKLPDCPNAKIKVATSNFMGYGLYCHSIYGLDDFISKFERRI